jgi:hypothetical protein
VDGVTSNTPSSLYRLGYAEVPVKIGPRSGYITKRERIEVVGDDPRHYPPLFALAVNPDMLDWLIESLPHGDGFTKELVALREDAKQTLWDRTAA